MQRELGWLATLPHQLLWCMLGYVVSVVFVTHTPVLIVSCVSGGNDQLKCGPQVLSSARGVIGS